MEGHKKQIKLDGVTETPPEKKEEPLSEGKLVKGILKLVGNWIPEYPSKERSDGEIFAIAFKDCSEGEKKRGEKIISLEIKRIHSTIEKLTVNRDQSKVVATNAQLLDSINKCFLALAIEPLRKDFFEVVLGHTALKSNTSFEEHVEKFNIISMYFFGNFEHAYKNLWSASRDEIKKYYAEIFPDRGEEDRRIKRYTEERLPFDDIDAIDGWDLWCLGYLAKSYLSLINENREKLLPLLREAKAKEISDQDEFDRMVQGKKPKIMLDPIIRKAALDYSSKPYGIYEFYLPFTERLENAIKVCENKVTEAYFDRIREKGRQNTATYLTLNEIDVYFATSMRFPSHFATTKMLIRDLFEDPEIKKMNLRYFDPTQSFSHDRIDKGIIECLMIKKARITIYNAQESDTFGKDSEAAVTLAEGGDVIVYIARLLHDIPEFQELYKDIDNVMVMDDSEGIEKIVDLIKAKKYATDIELQEIIKPGTGKAELVTLMIQNKGLTLLQNLYNEEKLKQILDHIGYVKFPPEFPTNFLLPGTAVYIKNRKAKWTYELFSLCTMINLEKRALVFKEGHPLSLQTSPEDGVARGVIITRDIPTTAKVLKALLCRTLRYYIEYGKYACLLRDVITKSPVRVVTRDKNLTVAFWSKHIEGRKKVYFSDLE